MEFEAAFVSDMTNNVIQLKNAHDMKSGNGIISSCFFVIRHYKNFDWQSMQHSALTRVSCRHVVQVGNRCFGVGFDHSYGIDCHLLYAKL